MAGDNPEYWPFPVLPPEQRTEHHWEQIRFLDEALRSGFRPCKYMDGEYCLEAPDGRSVWLLYRGRLGGCSKTRWELWLNDRTSRVLSYWVDDFDAAASSALAWVRGAATADVLAGIEGRIIRGPSLGQPAAAESA